jgi:hypothetical protein
MKKLILAFLLLLDLAHAKDDWISMEDSDEFTIYVHLASRQKNGDRVKTWFVLDQKQASDKINSQRLLIEFDCKSKMSNILSIIGFSGKMTTGKAIYSDDLPKGWKHIAPGTIGEGQFYFACFGK